MNEDVRAGGFLKESRLEKEVVCNKAEFFVRKDGLVKKRKEKIDSEKMLNI